MKTLTRSPERTPALDLAFNLSAPDLLMHLLATSPWNPDTHTVGEWPALESITVRQLLAHPVEPSRHADGKWHTRRFHDVAADLLADLQGDFARLAVIFGGAQPQSGVDWAARVDALFAPVLDHPVSIALQAPPQASGFYQLDDNAAGSLLDAALKCFYRGGPQRIRQSTTTDSLPSDYRLNIFSFQASTSALHGMRTQIFGVELVRGGKMLGYALARGFSLQAQHRTRDGERFRRDCERLDSMAVEYADLLVWEDAAVLAGNKHLLHLEALELIEPLRGQRLGYTLMKHLLLEAARTLPPRATALTYLLCPFGLRDALQMPADGAFARQLSARIDALHRYLDHMFYEPWWPNLEVVALLPSTLPSLLPESTLL